MIGIWLLHFQNFIQIIAPILSVTLLVCIIYTLEKRENKQSEERREKTKKEILELIHMNIWEMRALRFEIKQLKNVIKKADEQIESEEKQHLTNDRFDTLNKSI